MAEKQEQSFRVDTTIAIRAAIWSLLILFVSSFLTIAIGFELGGFQSFTLIFPILVGWLYTKWIYNRITPSYLEGAGGGALAGAIYAVLATVVPLFLPIFESLVIMSSSLRLTSPIAGPLTTLIVQCALLGSLGGAAVIFLRTQRIK